MIRHPMYGGVVFGCLGALLLYRTWATVAALMLIPAVVLRARREDAALEAEFGDEWRAYRANVPGWFPHLPTSNRCDTTKPAEKGPAGHRQTPS